MSRNARKLQGLAALAVAVSLMAGAFAFPAAASGKGKGSVHEPPYKLGPSGGDAWNHVEADPDTGRMGVFRMFPGFSPVVGCAPEPSAGWAMFQVKHKVKKPASKIVLNYDAALDVYSWITVGARGDNKEWLGVKKFQGPFAGSGKLTARLFDRPKAGDRITIEFGLQLGDACPQVGAAVAEFPSVTVK